MSLIREEVLQSPFGPVALDRVYGLLPTKTPTAPVTSGTVSTNDGNGNPIPSVRLNPAGDITGVILQAGLYDGQAFEVRNISAHTITADAVSTSHVADGTGCVLVALTLYLFKWDATAGYWMHSGL